MKFRRTIGLVLAGCMLARLVSPNVEAETQSTKIQNIYNDVDTSAWYANAVEYTYDYGLMLGHEGNFDPEGNMTRAMLITTLYRLSGSPTVVDTTPTERFQDVEAGSWYEDSVCWAYHTGVTTGYEGLPMFGTNDEVQRQQLAVFLYRYASNYGIDTSVTIDISEYKNYEMIDEYAKEAMAWAVTTKMISGIEYTDEVTGEKIYDLAPHESATRAQLAMILMRFDTYCQDYDAYDFGGAEIKVFGSAWESVKQKDIRYAEAINSVEEKYNVRFAYADILEDYADSQMDEVIIDSVQAGEPCVDIITLNAENMFGCMSNGVLYDMTNYVNHLGVNPIYMEAGTWQEKCYGVSYDHLGDSSVLVYDRDYLEEIGMEKTPTDMFMEGKWSYEDFEAYCSEMKAKLPEGVYPIGMYPYHWAAMAAGANGTVVADMDCNIGLMNEAYIEALKFYVEMEEKGLAYPMNQYEEENGTIVQDMAYTISDERIVMKRAEAWQLDEIGFHYGITYLPWGSNVTCDGDYTKLSDNYKVSTTYWSVDSIVNDSCDKLGIPGYVMMQIIYDFRAACNGGDNKYMHEAYQVSEQNINTQQDAALYQWGSSRSQMDASWVLDSGDILGAWESAGDVLLRYKAARDTNKMYYQQAREALAKYGIIIEEYEETMESKIESYIDAMTIKEKVAQMFVVLPEALMHVSNVTAAGEATRDAIWEIPVGGFIYMSNNIKSASQVKTMLSNVQKYSMERIRLPMFTCVDEEGGTVARINNSQILDVPKIGNMCDIGATGNYEAAYEVGDIMGGYLKELGFNVDFAPVADVLSNKKNGVVKYRSFGSDPALVSKMALSVAEGLWAHQVYATLKHFPGHGATEGDTHEGYAYTSKSLEELFQCELIPFQDGIDQGIDFIMAAHISLPNILEENVPVSLSYEMLTTVLREQMGYEGIVITDGMNMGAISKHYSSAEAAVKAIQAGVDIVLMPADFEAAYEGVLQSIENQEISVERIDESLRRILRVKLEIMDNKNV